MMNLHAKYGNMHRKGMLYALIYINNHLNTIISCILSTGFDAFIKVLEGLLTSNPRKWMKRVERYTDRENLEEEVPREIMMNEKTKYDRGFLFLAKKLWVWRV